MTSLFRSFYRCCLLLCTAPALAQGPTIDPGFLSGQVYRPGEVRDAFQQADGKRLFNGSFSQVDGVPVTGLVRLLAGSTQPDLAFQTAIAGLRDDVGRMYSLPANKTLVMGSNLQLAGVSRAQMMVLNADGTPDPGFNATVQPDGGIRALVVQPDGKLLITGDFTQVNGQAMARLARLNADGTLDSSFQPGAGLNGVGLSIALLPGGGSVVAGEFTSVQGQPRQAVAQLLPDGSPDPNFSPAVPSGTEIRHVAVQADGKLLLSASRRSLLTWPALARLLPTGAVDATFQQGIGFSQVSSAALGYAGVVVQPDGGILVPTAAATFNGTAIGTLVRLLPNGSLDASFDNQNALRRSGYARVPYSLQLLPGGQLLAGGESLYAGAGGNLPRAAVVLTASGVPDLAATPHLLTLGDVRTVVRQPDGKLLVGGNFTEINGAAAGYMVRLHANGTPDTAFTAGADGIVQSLILQPDGKLLVSGSFEWLAGSARIALGRLLASGSLDASFAPPLLSLGRLAVPSQVRAWRQPDGNILLASYFNLRSHTSPAQYIARVSGSTGQRDNTFVPADSTTAPNDLLVRANGSILVAGSATFSGQIAACWQMLPSGLLDPSFMRLTAPNSAYAAGTALAEDSAGKLYVARSSQSSSGTAVTEVVRLSSTGQPDASFQAVLPGPYNVINCLMVQPNGRVLLGGLFEMNSFLILRGIRRLLPDGTIDASLDADNGPREYDVNQLLIQPDGAIVAVGRFTQVGSLPINGLVRLLDPNVLSARHMSRAAQLEVWPVPAHGTLHLQFDAKQRPQLVQLFDVVGHVMQQEASPAAELTLNTSALPTGVYIVQVTYDTGTIVSRRVAVR